MKYISALATAMSGSLRGIVASHNAGGTYFRGRTVPVNTNTSQQQAVRNALALLAAAWGGTLTSSQRDGWNTYGMEVGTTNALGQTIHLSGINWYCACNTPRLQVGLSRIDAPPSVFNLATLTGPGVTSITATTRVAIVTFTNTDPWATAVGGSLLMYSSRPQDPGINYFKGPFQFAGRINGAGTAPTSPQNITTPFTLAAGQKVFWQFRALQADGRISPVFRGVNTTI